jgi:dihydrodipicolinate synthase/N-acetylneuraminate lyase
VGVHTTQFDIRRPEHRLFEPVLALAAATAEECDAKTGRRTVRIGGICGRTRQALREAAVVQSCGYHAGLLALTGFPKDPEGVVLRHCRTVAQEIPLIGFYLQQAVGGRVWSVDFWRRFAEIPNVVAIKIAAFNRYHTLDVVRAVAEAGRSGEIALYTGNDDHIVLDLLSEYKFRPGGKEVAAKIVGGLLGHWACWTSSAIRILEECRRASQKALLPQSLLTLAGAVTDCNAAFFDAANGFAGCIAGIHEVLRQQGLLENLVCLDPRQVLSPGQKRDIDRVYRAYPELNDDAFVRENVDNWMK